MKRKTLLSLLIPAIVLTVVLVFCSVWWFGKSYPAFEETFRKEEKIPALDTGISPQGLCPLPENERGYAYAMSGYLSGPSRVYLIAPDGEQEFFITLTVDGKPVSTHFGGITCTGNYLLVASGKKLLRVALADVMKAENGSAVEAYDSFDTGLQNAFCYAYQDKLYAGEFYRPGNYETDASHHIDVKEGKNHAFVYVFPIDESAEGGVAQRVPEMVISVCDQVQGIAVTDGNIFLSCSYGLPDSTLWKFSVPENAQRTVTVAGGEVPLAVLDPADGKKTDLPCMSEEIFEKDGRIYVLFESMSMKYRFVVHYRTCRIWSAAVSDL